jgi:hypothetical protein
VSHGLEKHLEESGFVLLHFRQSSG